MKKAKFKIECTKDVTPFIVNQLKDYAIRFNVTQGSVKDYDYIEIETDDFRSLFWAGYYSGQSVTNNL